MTSVEIFRELPNDILRTIYTQAVVLRNAENFEQKLNKTIRELNLWKEAADEVGFTNWEEWLENDMDYYAEIVIGNHEYTIPNGNKLKLYTTWHNESAWARYSAEITNGSGEAFSMDWDDNELLLNLDYKDDIIKFAKALGIQVDNPDEAWDVLFKLFVKS